jgi:hypothetical protein
MADLKPVTQYLSPSRVVDNYDQAIMEVVNEEMDLMEQKGIVLKQFTLSELRAKIRRRLRDKYTIKDGGPPSQHLLDTIIGKRINQ